MPEVYVFGLHADVDNEYNYHEFISIHIGFFEGLLH